jgi:hypothetical protein
MGNAHLFPNIILQSHHVGACFGGMPCLSMTVALYWHTADFTKDLIMRPPLMTKYVYQIRSRNGSVVDNLQIAGRDEEEARRKLQQMYLHCEILETRVLSPDISGNSSYEDVLGLISDSD